MRQITKYALAIVVLLSAGLLFAQQQEPDGLPAALDGPAAEEGQDTEEGGIVEAALPPVPAVKRLDSSIELPVLTAEGRPNDSGGTVVVHVGWRDSSGALRDDLSMLDMETRLGGSVDIAIYRAVKNEGEQPGAKDWERLRSVSYLPEMTVTDFVGPRRGWYKLRAETASGYLESQVIGPVIAPASWFDWTRLNLLLTALLVTGLIIGFIRVASKGKDLFVRRIHGLDAIDEAVGRATEMGRSVMFVPGIADVDDPQTIAGLTILGRVARFTASYQTELDVPVARSMVMVAGRALVREAYLAGGHPEAFREEMVHYITDDQFGYAAAVDGLMVREKPATIFYQGCFYAESLILAETGHSVGAIQIAGTAMVSQLPFFITACDYTLIGEELFAASAYLSREPRQLGSLKGQDYGKLAAMIAIALAVTIATVGEIVGNPHWTDLVRSLFTVVS